MAGPRRDEPALLGVAGEALSYGALRGLMDATAEALPGLGIGPEDRVALVAANGPRAASSFLSIAACCGCAPLNPVTAVRISSNHLRNL